MGHNASNTKEAKINIQERGASRRRQRLTQTTQWLEEPRRKDQGKLLTPVGVMGRVVSLSIMDRRLLDQCGNKRNITDQRVEGK